MEWWRECLPDCLTIYKFIIINLQFTGLNEIVNILEGTNKIQNKPEMLKKRLNG